MRMFLIIKKDVKRNKKYISEVVKSDMYPSDKAREAVAVEETYER